MAFADYYARTALAASQILAGFDEPRIRATLDKVKIGIAIGSDAAETKEGRETVDLLVRLLARIYPTLTFRWEGKESQAVGNLSMGLAQQINPNIELASEPTLEIAVGVRLPPPGSWKRIFVGSSGWNAFFSDSEPK